MRTIEINQRLLVAVFGSPISRFQRLLSEKQALKNQKSASANYSKPIFSTRQIEAVLLYPTACACYGYFF
jgi:hypothetical protein